MGIFQNGKYLLKRRRFKRILVRLECSELQNIKAYSAAAQKLYKENLTWVEYTQ